MLRGLMNLLLLSWYSTALSRVSGEDSSEKQVSLGQRVLNEHNTCESIISDVIDDIIDDEDSDPFDEIRIPELEKYHDCKEKLDKLKREYMAANQIENNSKFLTIKKTSEESKDIILSAPSADGAEVNELEFDVVDELCVTHRKCDNIFQTIQTQQFQENRNMYAARYMNCQILLDRVKGSYIEEEKLDKKKLKEADVMTVMCTGVRVTMPLPTFANNLDFHHPLHEVFGHTLETSEGDSGTGSVLESGVHSVEPHHEDHAVSGGNDRSHEGIPCGASAEKGDLVYCAVAVILLSILVNEIVV